MKRAAALCLLLLTVSQPACAADNAPALLNWTHWVDIGPGRSLVQLKPSEIARLRRCDDWSMYFQAKDEGIEQIFVAGLSMRTVYPKVRISQLLGERIVTLFPSQQATRPTDTLHLSADGTVLTQMSPPFRPHTYLRCASDGKAK